MTELASRLAQLSPRQRAALLNRLGHAPSHRETGAEAPIVRRVADGAVTPLSATQENMWFLEQFHPGTTMHVMSGVARLPLDVPLDVFADCLGEVIERHPVLRTRFENADGEPRARIVPAARPDVKFLSGLADDALWRAFEADATTPFDIAGEPLIRATLARAADGSSWVQVTLHHMVADGFSTGILFEELGRLATGRLVGSLQALPEVPFQYADVALWEADRAAGDADDSAIAYWTERLAHVPAALTLPTDHPRPARQSFRGRRTSFDLGADRAAAIRAFSGAHGVTPFVTVLTAYSAVLSRFSAQDAVVVGVPVAQRARPGTERVIGPLLNTLALAVSVGDQDSAQGLLEHVNGTVREGFAHRDAPIDRVLAALDLARDPARPPLFQAILNVQEDRSAPAMQMRDMFNGCAKYDVLLNVTTTPTAMTGTVDVPAELFDQASTDALIDAFLAVIDALVGAADLGALTVPALPLATVAPTVPAPAAQPVTAASLDAYVLAAAGAAAQRTAIIAGDEAISYAELERRVESLAALIRDRIDAPSQTPLGLLLPRSPHVVVAMLATLRAGYSFIPLDPAYPADRLKFICADAGVPALISTDADRAEVPGLDLPWIDVTAVPQAAAPSTPADAPETRTAYLLYTSGSTGKPKGVRVSHRNVMTFLAAMAAEPGITADDTLLAVTSPSFDIAILELLLPLAAGATVVLADADDARDGLRLARLLDEHRVTMMQATPTTWHLLLDAGWRRTVGLRALCGGEAMPAALAGRLLDGADEVWNMYGPTETTIWSTVHRVTADDVRRGAVPIGHPIAGTGIVVLDAALQPVPDGVFGELGIIGDGVTLGYHDRPALTADRFVELPASGLRAYRTGDLVRRTRGGRIEFGGRIDTQVKVRGFRVELGDIESALENALPGVRAIAAVDPSGAAITAYLESPAEALGDTAALLEALRGTLPPYMVPTVFVAVEAFPLTPNRKIDRKAIAGSGTPIALAAAGGAEYVAARTPLERDLTAIWTDLLGLSTAPGVHDDFFLLGGHSLLATKLVFRVREGLGTVVPLPVLFAGELTIARLAAILENGGAIDNPLVLADEAAPPEHIRPTPGAHVHRASQSQNVFLTGGTGFVGSFLLAELLTTSTVTVHALVRAADAASGAERLRAALVKYGIWDEAFADRIVAVPGDLTRPRLGLSDGAWAGLAGTVDSILHCGADVNFLRPYQSLKAANVGGTIAVLELACDGAVKPVHFVSTTYVFSRFSYPKDTEFSEDDREPIQDLRTTFGYTQSKWVGEQLVFAARRRGVPTYVYRTGRVAGHSVTGACQESDFLWQTIRLGVTLGAAPIMDMSTDMTPVDYVVGAIARLFRNDDLVGRSFHVVSKETVAVPDLVRWMADYGYDGAQVPFGQWCEMAADLAERTGDATAAALAPFLSATPLDRMPDATFAMANVEAGLADTDVVCPPIDGALLRRYFDWFVGTGYLAAPAGVAGSSTVTS